jgi:beta-lactamase regulating signal transducer with metallopeptidase domain
VSLAESSKASGNGQLESSATASSSGAGTIWSSASFRGLWKRLEVRVTLPRARFEPHVKVAAIIFLGGAGAGLVRLLLGVWAVRACRRRGRLVDDVDMNRLLESLRLAMGCRPRVEVLEVADLPTPATAGWRRPMVLLPADWRSWDEQERLVVLAHELAHIQRSDYAAGLIARLAVTLHFYHPLVRWMAGRLQLQQELAADALGAQHAGGRGPYLRILSELALRQQSQASCWPVRAFLPAKGTLIRRIKMLRTENTLRDRPWSRARRLMAVSSLVAVAVGVTSLRGPTRAADLDAPVDDAANAPQAARPAAGLPNTAFELSYVPTDAMGLIAMRPAAAFHRAGMDRYAAAANQIVARELMQICQPGLASAKCPLRLEAIDQVTLGVYLRSSGVKKPPRSLVLGGLMVRTTEPFDWKAQIQAWLPGMTEVHEGSHVYYRLPSFPFLGPNGGAYFPDDRTMVIDQEKKLLSLLRRAAPAPPAYAQGADWGQVHRGLVAWALDNRDGQWARELKEDAADPAEVQFAKLFEHADRWVFGVGDADEFVLRAIASCGNDQAREATTRATELLLKTCRELVAQPDPAAAKDPQADQEDHLVEALLTGSHVEREGFSVLFRSSSATKLVDLFALVLSGGSK